MAGKLRVAIDCRITSFQQGVGTAVLALAKALSKLGATDQEYTFIVRENMLDCLAPYVYGPCTVKGIPGPRFSTAKAALRWMTPLRSAWHKYYNLKEYVPVSDGYVESQHYDVVHFITQVAYLTELPSIYQPHDLQHVHYPEFFSPSEVEQRDRLYRAFCRQAAYVCVQTEWTRRDVIGQYGIAKDKVVVIPWGSVFDAYKEPTAKEIDGTVEKFGLPKQFFFFPAATWQHKNHAVIFRAVRILKTEQGMTPSVFFTGASTEYRPSLDRLARELGISDCVRFLGFVTSKELQAIFKVATAMIYPSRFEGFGLPILEAFHSHLPVLSSNATVLPEVGREGALYFDPESPRELAALMRLILREEDTRKALIEKGLAVLARSTFSDTAAEFRALYARTVALRRGQHQGMSQ